MKTDDEHRVTVTAAYDTPEAGKRIVWMLDRIGAQAGDEVSFDVRLWSADVLNLPAAYDRARDDVAGSELVAVSLGGDGRIWTGLKDLVEEWLEEHRGQASALLVLPPDAGADAPMVSALRVMARRNGLDFICSEISGGQEAFGGGVFCRSSVDAGSREARDGPGVTPADFRSQSSIVCDEFIHGGNGNYRFRFR